MVRSVPGYGKVRVRNVYGSNERHDTCVTELREDDDYYIRTVSINQSINHLFVLSGTRNKQMHSTNLRTFSV